MQFSGPTGLQSNLLYRTTILRLSPLWQTKEILQSILPESSGIDGVYDRSASHASWAAMVMSDRTSRSSSACLLNGSLPASERPLKVTPLKSRPLVSTHSISALANCTTSVIDRLGALDGPNMEPPPNAYLSRFD
jgi:hypothetical protein